MTAKENKGMKAVLKQQEATALAKSILIAIETGVEIRLDICGIKQYITPVFSAFAPYRATIFLSDKPVTESQKDEAKTETYDISSDADV